MTRIYINDSATDAEKDAAYGLPAGATAAARAWDQKNPEPPHTASQIEGYAHYEARIKAGHDPANSREVFGWGRLNASAIGDADPICGEASGAAALRIVEASILGPLSPEGATAVVENGIHWS